LADFAYTSQKKIVAAAIKTEDDDTATATIKRFTNRFKKLSGQSNSVAGTFTVPKDSTDYSKTIDDIKASGADTVFVTLSAENSIEFMKQAMDKKLMNVLFLGTRSWNDDKLIKYLKENDRIQAAFPTEQSQNAETEVSNEFIQAFKAKYGESEEPSARTAVAFDAYCLAIDAISRAYDAMQTMDPDKLTADAATDAEGRTAKEVLQNALETGIPAGEHIRDALSQTKNFQGASGVINYNGKNEATKSITINFIVGGIEQPTYTIE